MKKHLSAFLFAVAFIQVYCKAQLTFTTVIVPSGSTTTCGNANLVLADTTPSNVWIRRSDFANANRTQGVAFSIGDKGYFGTGWNPYYQKDFWEYDPVTDVWTQKANFGGTGRLCASGFSIGGKGYIGLGGLPGINNYSSDFWEYNPIANTWIQRASFPGGARGAGISFNTANKGYFGLGDFLASSTLTVFTDLWEYDPVNDTWTKKANFPGVPKSGRAAFSIGNKGYVGTGGPGIGIGTDFWEYDPAADLWSQKANFPGGPRTRATGLSIGCKGYMGLGYDSTNTVSHDFWEYDPFTDNWTQTSNFPGNNLINSSGFSINHKGYIAGGEGSGGFSTPLWEYNPGLSYNWSNGATTPAITPTISGIYSLTITSNCYTASASQTVSINPNPTVTVNNAIVCSGNSAVLSATVNPSSGTTYSWSPNSSSDYSVTVNPLTTTNYTVTATYGGCSSIAVSSVSVNPTTTAVSNFSYTSPFCSTDPDPLPVLSAGTTPNGAFSSTPGLLINPATGAINLSGSPTGTYSVTYSVAQNTCILSNSSTSTIVINNPSPPVTNFTYPDLLCTSAGTITPTHPPDFSGGGIFTATPNLPVGAANGNIDLLNSTPGTYTVSYTINAGNCLLAGAGQHVITIHSSPTITVNPDITIMPGADASFTSSSSAGTYTWYPADNLSCTNCANPIASPPESVRYCIKTTDGTCENSACVTIIVEPPCLKNYDLSLPNAFSPNGDDNNDLYCLQGWDECVTDFKILIYDRWGEKVFESTDPSFCWDGYHNGKLLNPAVFVYDVRALFNKSKALNKKGNVTLLR